MIFDQNKSSGFIIVIKVLIYRGKFDIFALLSKFVEFFRNDGMSNEGTKKRASTNDAVCPRFVSDVSAVKLDADNRARPLHARTQEEADDGSPV